MPLVRKRHAAGLGAILMAVALALVMYQARGRDGERADRTLSQQGADRFHQHLQEVEERCSRLQAGDGGIVDRHAVRRDIAALGRFARAHKGAFFPEDAPGVQAELNTVVSYWVWDVSCTDPEARQLHGIVPVPLEPTELSGCERVALALAMSTSRAGTSSTDETRPSMLNR